jgi:hypothetical protein
MKTTLILFALLVCLPAGADTLRLDEPCFQVNIEVDPAYVVELRAFHEGQLVVVDRTGFPVAISEKFCGLGDWLVELRTGAECIELLEYRSVTGEPCLWSDWEEAVTANVQHGSLPNPPIFLVRIDRDTRWSR